MLTMALTAKWLWILSCSLLWNSQCTDLRRNQHWNKAEWGLSWRAAGDSFCPWLSGKEQDFRKLIQSWVSRACVFKWSEAGSGPWAVMDCCLLAVRWPTGVGWWHLASDAVWPLFPLSAICPHWAEAAAASHTRGRDFRGNAQTQDKNLETAWHLFSFKAGDFHRFKAPQDFGATKINQLREHVRNPFHVCGADWQLRVFS